MAKKEEVKEVKGENPKLYVVEVVVKTALTDKARSIVVGPVDMTAALKRARSIMTGEDDVVELEATNGIINFIRRDDIVECGIVDVAVHLRANAPQLPPKA